MTRTFADKVVVVTGGAGGIGRALCRRFAQGGARIAALDLDADALAGVEREGVLAIRCDVTKPDDCERAIAEVRERLGGVDVLVNNAGLVHRSSFRDTDVDVFRRVMEVNFFGSLNVTKAALESLISRRGLIIVTSSIAGLVPLYGRSGYSASKHALHGLFETLRSELEPEVGVLMVCPSFTQSGFEARALDAHGARVTRGRSKVGNEATPESVADAVFEAARKNRRLLVLSPVGKLAVWLSRVAPALYQKNMVKQLASELGQR